MNAIEQWKSKGAPYNEGVLLYGTLPNNNKTLLKNFQKKHSPQLYEKLKYELSKIDNYNQPSLSAHLPQKPSQQSTSKTDVVHYIEAQQTQFVTKQALYFHELPAALRPILLEANALFKEMCLLKVQLNELPVEAEIKALAIQLKISEKQKHNALCWEKLDYWKIHKVAPKEAKGKFETLTPANLVKKEQYLFASISKMKKRLLENKDLLNVANGVNEVNKVQRIIAKQQSALIAKNEELINIKRIINGN